MKIKLMANSKSSIDINKVKIFLRLTTIPKTPIKNNIKKINILRGSLLEWLLTFSLFDCISLMTPLIE